MHDHSRRKLPAYQDREIRDAIRSTWESVHARVHRLPGSSVPVVEPLPGRLLTVVHTAICGTDGVEGDPWPFAAEDALAVGLNELLVVRATPYKLGFHLHLDADDGQAVRATVNCLAAKCRSRQIVLTGGTTWVTDPAKDRRRPPRRRTEYVGVTLTGFCEGKQGSTLRPGDCLVGLPSHGVHASGLRVLRRFFSGAALRRFAEPTANYWDRVHPLWHDLNGAVHVAEGGITRIRDFLNDGVAAVIHRQPVPAVFQEIFRDMARPSLFAGTDAEMYATFNCGIGMVLSVPQDRADSVAAHLSGKVIGEVREGAGPLLTVESAFSDRVLRFGDRADQPDMQPTGEHAG